MFSSPHSQLEVAPGFAWGSWHSPGYWTVVVEFGWVVVPAASALFFHRPWSSTWTVSGKSDGSSGTTNEPSSTSPGPWK